ncbi:MAG TPA: methyltransferase domain-containing protein [Sumerlaeia bacterium]|nr:methyltransferase domain-containing protein [Sumerlaeia bacterium]
MIRTGAEGEEAECPICGGRKVRHELRLGPEYRTCRHCGFLWRAGRAHFPNPNRAYAEGGGAARDLLSQEERKERTAYYQSHLARLHRFVSPPGRLLEIGCGTGGLSRAALDAGWDVQAIEPSPLLRRAAEHLLGHERVLGCSLESAEIEEQSFDVVLALDVIEHIPDPLLLPERVGRWLRSGGVLALQTPNAHSLRRRLCGSRWNMIQPDRHFLFHTMQSLRTLFQTRGFETLLLRTASGTGVGGALRRAAARIYGRLLAAFGLGNALYLIARRGDSSEASGN